MLGQGSYEGHDTGIRQAEQKGFLGHDSQNSAAGVTRSASWAAGFVMAERLSNATVRAEESRQWLQLSLSAALWGEVRPVFAARPVTAAAGCLGLTGASALRATSRGTEEADGSQSAAGRAAVRAIFLPLGASLSVGISPASVLCAGCFCWGGRAERQWAAVEMNLR
ncbi:uncharacterized protein BDR25DRAFT_387560 [Lindgomyces ingoldianus]|uniref:Uncharacterized protein n=1 Tax=Lindgomyces ingoldianus TaxID=673940 RepID=A0ACB6R268_9PLEO|nr:uncharacterized protein BDR25DRAFT_387560 [Lindgomyces ingoldianus]KAF2473373.1 hypothetical protein BDR25DRAFT_387560 [Lindgomyces ingoldianus]